MYGFPKRLKTQIDYERCHGEALQGSFGRGTMIATWQALLDSRYKYTFDRILSESEEPDGSEPEYKVLEDEDGSRRQYILAKDAQARIYKLGFSETMVNSRISELEAE